MVRLIFFRLFSLMNLSFFLPQVSIELGSDHKDFATSLARTRLAEMTKHKVIPIPPPRPALPRTPEKSRSKSRSRSGSRTRAGRYSQYFWLFYGQCQQNQKLSSKQPNLKPPDYNWSESSPLIWYYCHSAPISTYSLLFISSFLNRKRHERCKKNNII